MSDEYKPNLLERFSTKVLGSRPAINEGYKMPRQIMAKRGRKSMSSYWSKPKNVTSFFSWYKTDGVLKQSINSLVEPAVGLGFFTVMPSGYDFKTDKDGNPIIPEEKKLVDEFSRTQNLEMLIPNIARTMLIAGFCPVETKIVKSAEKSLVKIIHPETVKTINYKADGTLNSIIQQGKTDEGALKKEVKIDGDNLTWFVYNQIANDLRGISVIKGTENLLSAKHSAIQNMNGIIRRYLAPKLIWMSSQDISPLKELIDATEADEDFFIGNLGDEFIPDIEKSFTVKPLEVDGDARFWEYIDYIDSLIWVAINSPNQKWWRSATEASANVLSDVVDRNLQSIQRTIENSIEDGFFKRFLEANGVQVTELNIPRVQWGVPKTGVEDVDVSGFLSMGVQNAYLDRDNYFEILNIMGVPVKQRVYDRPVTPTKDIDANEPSEPKELPEPKPDAVDEEHEKQKKELELMILKNKLKTLQKLEEKLG